jgi:hypothetical protein
MAQHTPHARLLSEAAREILGPLGLVQCGRTRFWIDDRQWWLGIVEFEPSGFSRGSCLKVGAMWLWLPRERFSFDVRQRSEKFATFHNKSQFEREAARLAQKAADRVEAHRAQFVDPRSVAEYLLRHEDNGNPYHQFHTAVACALAGRDEHARTHFDRLLHSQPRADGEHDLHREAQRLRQDVGHLPLVLIAMEQRVLAARELLRLPSVACVDFNSSPAGDAA